MGVLVMTKLGTCLVWYPMDSDALMEQLDITACCTTICMLEQFIKQRIFTWSMQDWKCLVISNDRLIIVYFLETILLQKELEWIQLVLVLIHLLQTFYKMYTNSIHQLIDKEIEEQVKLSNEYTFSFSQFQENQSKQKKFINTKKEFLPFHNFISWIWNQSLHLDEIFPSRTFSTTPLLCFQLLHFSPHTIIPKGILFYEPLNRNSDLELFIPSNWNSTNRCCNTIQQFCTWLQEHSTTHENSTVEENITLYKQPSARQLSSQFILQYSTFLIPLVDQYLICIIQSIQLFETICFLVYYLPYRSVTLSSVTFSPLVIHDNVTISYLCLEMEPLLLHTLFSSDFHLLEQCNQIKLNFQNIFMNKEMIHQMLFTWQQSISPKRNLVSRKNLETMEPLPPTLELIQTKVKRFVRRTPAIRKRIIEKNDYSEEEEESEYYQYYEQLEESFANEKTGGVESVSISQQVSMESSGVLQPSPPSVKSTPSTLQRVIRQFV